MWWNITKELRIIQVSVELSSKLFFLKKSSLPLIWSYLVTLKIRRRRTQRNTEIPRGDIISNSTKMVSTMPPHTTKQSKRLNRDTKYDCRPKLYIFTNISQVNKARRTLLAISRGEIFRKLYWFLHLWFSFICSAENNDSFYFDHFEQKESFTPHSSQAMMMQPIPTKLQLRNKWVWFIAFQSKFSFPS